MLDVFDGILAARLCGTGGASPTPPAPVLIEKTVTANGVYNAEDDHADGYSSVTVNTPQLPVTFLKSIKSQGNSVILTDIVPDYNWTAAVDTTIGAALSAKAGYFFASRTYNSSELIGLYGAGIRNDNRNIIAYCGNDWNASGNFALNASEADFTRNTLYLRRNITSLGSSAVTVTASINKSSISAELAFFGSCIKDVSTSETELEPEAAREITLYGAKLYDGTGALRHNLVPAQSKATGRGGLYDVITGTFYPSDSNYDDFIKEEIINE